MTEQELAEAAQVLSTAPACDSDAVAYVRASALLAEVHRLRAGLTDLRTLADNAAHVNCLGGANSRFGPCVCGADNYNTRSDVLAARIDALLDGAPDAGD